MAQPQASPITDVAPTRVVVGILDGANHRTGRFDMHAEDAASIAGQVAKGGKALLLNKVIGETYEFELRSTVDSAGGEPKWELLRLRALAGSALTTTMRTTREVLAAIPRVLPKAIVPQGTLARVIQVVEIVASGKVLSAETIDLSQRHIDYHKQAARVLLLLDDDGTLLLAGATLVALPNVRRLAHLAIQFEVSVVGRAWMKWAGVTGLTELNPDSAEDFLRAKSALDKKSMIERRGRTLREWARELAPHGTPRTNDEAARGKSRVRSADPGPSPAR